MNSASSLLHALREKATAPACRSDVVTHAFHDVTTFLSSARRPTNEANAIMMCQRVAGAVDFFLRVVAVDVPHYEAFYRRLTGLMPLRGVSAYIAVQQLKFETALPLYLVPESSARGEHEEDGVSS